MADGAVLFASLRQEDSDLPLRLLVDPVEIGLHHGLGCGHLGGDGDLRRGSVAPVLRDGRHVDVVGRER